VQLIATCHAGTLDHVDQRTWRQKTGHLHTPSKILEGALFVSYDERTYHGVPLTDGYRIEVEEPVYGTIERQDVTVLYELPAIFGGEFGWGYVGGSPFRAATALLADALDLTEEAWSSNLPIQLRNDFCYDPLSQFTGEWRLRRGLILRWVLARYVEQGRIDLPTAVLQLPARLS
jgi:hypothetical protein